MCFRLHTHGVKFDMSALNCQPLQRLAHYCSLVVTAAAADRGRGSVGIYHTLSITILL